MIKKQINDIKPKVWRVLLITGLITYIIKILATFINGFLNGYPDIYTITSWLTDLSVPLIAFIIGFILSLWRQPKNRVQFAGVFAINAYLLCQIGNQLLPYLSDAWGPWGMLARETMPAIVALAVQTIVSIILIFRHSKKQPVDPKLFILILVFIALLVQAIQTVQQLPAMINFTLHTNNIWNTPVLPIVIWLVLVVPVIIFAALIVINSIYLKPIKNIVNRLFLASLTAVYASMTISSLTITVGSLTPLHDIVSLWVCIIGYSIGLILNGVIIHRLRILSV
ncbi:MAG: hypothetical protein WCH58_03545 [Candidatus Saccharibacteria bacterium]